jgi:hypothetical protein
MGSGPARSFQTCGALRRAHVSTYPGLEAGLEASGCRFSRREFSYMFDKLCRGELSEVRTAAPNAKHVLGPAHVRRTQFTAGHR